MGQYFNRPGSNLVTVAKETGFPVKAVAGWETRGHGGMASTVKPIVCHHTAGPSPERTKSNYPSFYVVRDGRSGLPGPLSQYGIGFDGTIYVFAAGLAYHAGSGSWKGWSGNSVAIGIEAEDNGDGTWLAPQLDVYPRLCAALCQFLGVGAEWVCGHKEWSPGRKIDPAGINMNEFRSKVNWYLKNPNQIRKGSTPTPPKEDTLSAAEVEEIKSEIRKWVATRNLDYTIDGETKTGSLRSITAYGRTDAYRAVQAAQANSAAIVELAKALAAHEGLDADELIRRVEEAIANAVIDVDVTVTDRAAEEEQA